MMAIRFLLASFALALGVSLGGAQATAAPAGRLVMSIGLVQVVRDGAPSAARSGTEVNVGDAVRTGPKGTAQIWLTDGSMISLRERSEYRIDQHNFGAAGSHADDASSGSLIKGGARVLTGAIAKANPQAVKVNSRVATIGIRGTGFDLVDCLDQCFGANGAQAAPGLYGTVIEGAIVARNEAGELLLTRGQSFFVARPDTAALRLLKPADFMAEPPAVEGSGQSTAGTAAVDAPVETPPDSREQGGAAFDVQGGVKLNPPQEELRFPEPPAVRYNTASLGSGVLPSASSSSLVVQTSEYNPVTAERNVINQVTDVMLGVLSGRIVSMRQPTNPTFPGYVISGYTATQQEGGADGALAWGRWSDGSVLLGRWSGAAANPKALRLEANQGFHWIIGDRATNYPGNGRYTFDLIGATTPTETRAGALGGWQVTGGQLVADIPAGTLNGSLSLFVARQDGYGKFQLDFASSGPLGGLKAASPIATSVLRTSGSINLCTAACTGVGGVQFYGNDPGRPAANAGLTYEFNTGDFYVMGVAAFRRP